MNIRELSIKREDVKYVTEANTLQEALDIMKENNFRSLPILSQSGTMYRGNIYRQHIYIITDIQAEIKFVVVYYRIVVCNNFGI